MEKNELILQIADAIKETLNDETLIITPQTRLIDDLEIDSVDGLSLIMELEEKTGLHIPDEKLIEFVTVGDIANYLNRRLNE